MALRLDSGSWSPLTVLRDHTQTRHTRQGSYERVTSPTLRSLPDKVQHSQEANIHAPGDLRTHSLSKTATADPRLRPRSHWDRHKKLHFA